MMRLLKIGIEEILTEYVASSWIDMLGGFSRWYMRRMPPDFGCCATASVGTATATATAKLRSLVFILSLPVTRVGSPDRPAVVLRLGHASRCGAAGQPGRRAKRCGLNSPVRAGITA